jgi:hypothetical protein
VAHSPTFEVVVGMILGGLAVLLNILLEFHEDNALQAEKFAVSDDVG